LFQKSWNWRISRKKYVNQLRQNVNSNGIQFMKRNLTGYQFGIYWTRLNDFFNYTVTRHRWICQKLKYRIFRSALIHVLAHFQQTTCSQIYFRFSLWKRVKTHVLSDQSVHITHTYYCVSKLSKFGAYLYSRVHILTAIGWFIVNIQSDLFWHRCLERQAFGTTRMYALSPSKSIKGSNFGEFRALRKILYLSSWQFHLCLVTV
jgi:hypothetical protein